MSFRDDLPAMWGSHPEAYDGAGYGHGPCPRARDRACAPIGLHDPGTDDPPVRWRTAPSFLGTAAHAIGDALIVGGVLVRFFAFVAPLIVRYYVRRLWLGLPGRARRTDDPRRAAGAGAVAVRANGPSNDHAGLVIHDIAKPPQDDRPRDGGMAFALPADWGLSPHAPAASGGVSSSSFRGHSDLGCVDRQRQAASGAPLRRKGAPFGGDALPILGQALVFASAIGCLFGVLAVLARLV